MPFQKIFLKIYAIREVWKKNKAIFIKILKKKPEIHYLIKAKLCYLLSFQRKNMLFITIFKRSYAIHIFFKENLFYP